MYLGSKKIGGTGDLSKASIDELRDVLISGNLLGRSLLIYDDVLKQWTNKTIDELFPIFKGATSVLPGLPGLVPAPSKGEINKFLRSDGVWADITAVDGDSSLFKTVDTTFFSIENQTLGLKDLPTSKIVGLDAKLSAVDGLFNALNNKVDKQENARLMTFEEGDKLSSLLGIREVSSDFSFNNGLLSLNQKVTTEIENIQNNIDVLNKKIENVEEFYTWDNL